ncbi:MAG: SpoIIE family protein phosphatase [Bacteroidetes bacterium]|nr:SpoIIE family protein phosphatase [Bacteroidota bacterium]MBL6944373.1 SpoIIE family protein phosphatase [Bacteroidales bacterium]
MILYSTYPIAGFDQINESQQFIVDIAKNIGFNHVAQSEISIIVSELANNLVKFPGEGKIVVNAFNYNHKKVLDIVSIDYGPGIENTEVTMRDGFTTSASMGTGLGAVKRLSDEFDLFSVPANLYSKRVKPITVIFARKWLTKEKSSIKNNDFKIGCITRPMPGFEENGDGIFFTQSDGEICASVIDGIGHGYEANIASQAAIDYLEKNNSEEIEPLLNDLHLALIQTQGAVIAIARLSKRQNKLIYGGIGNISARVFNSPIPVHPLTMNGSLGGRINHIRAYEHQWVPGSVLLMTSDGISNRWDISDFKDLHTKHPAIIAHIVFDQFSRQNDDATVLVIK